MSNGWVRCEGQEDAGHLYSHRWGPGGKGACDGAEMQGMAVDGARDEIEMWGEKRGGVWACMRGVEGETCGMAMCALRGPGCAWHMCKGCGQGRQSVVCGLWSGGRGRDAASGWAEGGAAAKTGYVARCYMRDRGSMGASGVM